ncbi:MAG TPA: DUF952 domain-containing protein [Thermomicrobiales bacterium]|nr:DUF952 domain-containing protein [Thermomicrobiales bacterium]
MNSSPEPYLHLIAEDVWSTVRTQETYVPDAFAADGFIHCTLGDERMLEVANLFYQSDPRSMLLLTLDPARVGSPVRFDDPEQVFPHIYGPLAVASVTGYRPIARDTDGRFTGYGELVPV